MVYFKLVKVTINTSSFAKVIIDVIIRHYDLLNSIVTNWELFLTLKFWLFLCYFLGIKYRLFIAFYMQTDGYTKKQNRIIEAYF